MMNKETAVQIFTVKFSFQQKSIPQGVSTETKGVLCRRAVDGRVQITSSLTARLPHQHMLRETSQSEARKKKKKKNPLRLEHKKLLTEHI